jgi:hypothetical protein
VFSVTVFTALLGSSFQRRSVSLLSSLAGIFQLRSPSQPTGLQLPNAQSSCCGFVDVGRSLWREDGSVIYSCCWPRQRSRSWVRDPWHSWPYFTVSDSRLPFSSPPTTRRATVEVFDPASTRDRPLSSSVVASRMYRTDRVGNTATQLLHYSVLRICYLAMGVFAEPFPSNGYLCWLDSSCLEQICHNTYIQAKCFYISCPGIALSFIGGCCVAIIYHMMP